MQQDLAEGRGGSAELTTASGETILLDYILLSVGDWFLVTMVPRNILSAEVDAFLSRTSFLILGLVTAFTGVLIAAIRAQSRYRARIEEMAFGDPVTGGESNICFLMEAEALLSRTPRQAFFLVSLNLRNFSMLNEQGGRAMGTACSKRSTSCCGRSWCCPASGWPAGRRIPFICCLRSWTARWRFAA